MEGDNGRGVDDRYRDEGRVEESGQRGRLNEPRERKRRKGRERRREEKKVSRGDFNLQRSEPTLAQVVGSLPRLKSISPCPLSVVEGDHRHG